MLLTAVLRRTDSGDTLLWADAADDIIAIHGYRSTFRMLAAETTAYPREVAEHAWSYQLPDVVERAYQRGTHFVNRTALMDDWGAFCTQVNALMPVWYCSTTSRPFSGSSTLVDKLTFTQSRSLEPIPLADQMWNSMTKTGKRKLKMQAIYVELPPDDLIEPSVLVKVIVNALYPDKTEGLTGIDCIIGKRVHVVTQPLTAKKTDLFGDANEPFWENRLHDMELSPQLALPLPKPKLTQYLVDGVVEDENYAKFWLPYHLTEDDLVKLRQLLKSLPPLAYPMTEGAISRFMDAYLAHPARPDWVPEFISHATICLRLEARAARSEEHWEAIRLAIECGEISACNSNRVPTRILSSGALISRSSAVEYLKRCGISVVGESQPTNRTDNDESDHQEAIFTASGNRVWTKVGGQEAWTKEELEAIEARLRSKNPRTEKKYTNTEVAKLIGLTSASRITQLMTELKKQRLAHANSPAAQLNWVSESV